MSESQSIARTITELAQRDPDRPAVTCGDEQVTRLQLERRANRLARAYEQLGVEQGSFVTIALPNSVESYVVAAAIWKLGAVPQPVSSRLPRRERQAIVELADSVLVVGADDSDHPGRQCLPIGFEPGETLDDAPLDDRISPAWKAATSGGSTGRPKLIVAGKGSDLGTSYGAPFFMVPDECQLVPGPLYHNAPFSVSTAGLVMGHHLVVLPKFDARTALEAIAEHQVTWVNLVPTMMLRMLREIEANPGRYDLTSLRIVWHMAAPCAAWLKEAWIDLVGPERLFELYGGTEAQSLSMISGTEWLAHRGSVGKPMSGQMIVMSEEGTLAAPGEVGEVFMRTSDGGAPTYHYIGAQVRERDGWESIGDLGWVDDEGYLYLSDRRTDLILAGGANIYPAEVEAAIDEHPAVLSSVVVGLPDEDLGQRVHAVVQAAPPLTTEALLEHLAERLVRYKIPRSFEFVEVALRDDAGKVRRSAVRDAAVARMEQQAHTK